MDKLRTYRAIRLASTFRSKTNTLADPCRELCTGLQATATALLAQAQISVLVPALPRDRMAAAFRSNHRARRPGCPLLVSFRSGSVANASNRVGAGDYGFQPNVNVSLPVVGAACFGLPINRWSFPPSALRKFLGPLTVIFSPPPTNLQR